MGDEHRREYHLIVADIFHTRHLMSGEDNRAYDQFASEVRILHGDALLKKKLVFGQLPDARADGTELRLAQHLCLIAALMTEFGPEKWERELKRFVANYDH